jgi:hypothetical protein
MLLDILAVLRFVSIGHDVLQGSSAFNEGNAVPLTANGAGERPLYDGLIPRLNHSIPFHDFSIGCGGPECGSGESGFPVWERNGSSAPRFPTGLLHARR